MAKYTFELREVISTFGQDEVKNWFKDYELSDYLTPEEIAVINERGVWNKDKLATRIINHYFLREIGQEAIGSFRLMIKDKMDELMETYAPLIYSASIKYDPLVNVNFQEIFDRTSDDNRTTSANTQSNSNGLVINSDTPQGNINKSDILTGKYASSTSGTESTSESNDSSSSSGSGNEHYVRKTIGNSGVSATSQAMIKQYREIIRALNTEIVYELEDLFMGIY